MSARHQMGEAFILQRIAECEHEIEQREAAILVALDSLLRARRKLRGWVGRLEASHVSETKSA